MYPDLPNDILKILEGQKRLEEKLNFLTEMLMSRADRQMLRHAENILQSAQPPPPEEVHEGEVVPARKISDLCREDYLDLLR